MTHVFDRDIHSQVFPEISELSSDDPDGLRLNPLEEVERVVAALPSPLVVAKPLVESQNALKLLGHFPDAKVIWMYRNYRDVVASNLARFGLHNGIDDIAPIARADETNWRAERVPETTHQMVRERFSEDMNPHDAAALFWITRNRLFFDNGLQDEAAVTLCRYETLVDEPETELRRLYSFIGRPHPAARLVDNVHPDSVGAGAGFELSEDVERACEHLLDELDGACRNQSP